MKRYRVGESVENFRPPVAVLDDVERAAIALCWSREKAQLIVDSLNVGDALATMGEGLAKLKGER